MAQAFMMATEPGIGDRRALWVVLSDTPSVGVETAQAFLFQQMAAHETLIGLVQLSAQQALGNMRELGARSVDVSC